VSLEKLLIFLISVGLEGKQMMLPILWQSYNISPLPLVVCDASNKEPLLLNEICFIKKKKKKEYFGWDEKNQSPLSDLNR
jgi:hypothetical protein